MDLANNIAILSGPALTNNIIRAGMTSSCSFNRGKTFLMKVF